MKAVLYCNSTNSDFTHYGNKSHLYGVRLQLIYMCAHLYSISITQRANVHHKHNRWTP